jgi:hypothetical protein
MKTELKWYHKVGIVGGWAFAIYMTFYIVLMLLYIWLGVYYD